MNSLLKNLFISFIGIFLLISILLLVILWNFSNNIPDYKFLKNYKPPVSSKVYAGDGNLVADFSKEKRIFVPYRSIPKNVINAFLSAEDKNFFSHPGVDAKGVLRATINNFKNIMTSKRLEGASTITQQVAKNFLLTNEVSLNRKLKEAILAFRIERALTKERILELYLNQIYLGSGAYGVAAASLEYFDKSIKELDYAEAALLALDDAGLDIGNMEAFYCGNLGQANAMVGQRILQEIGQTGIPVVNCSNACATGATAFREAWTSIKAGLYDVVLAVGVEQMGTGLLGGAGGGVGIPKEGLLGSGTMPAVFAEAGMEHARQYGTTFEQFAKISVKNHHHSTMNPKARYQIETPLDEVMNAEMISYPNTKLMCSVNVDGAAAAVLVSEKKAKELGMQRAVRIKASVMTSDPYQERDLVMPDVNSCTRKAAAEAYEMAGLNSEDIDLVELHDCFATAEMLHYENLGLCGDGEAGRLIDEGEVELGGRIPVNVSGGLLSKGHPLGATGIANIYEVCTHLRGEAGARQVENAKIGMTHVIGLGSACGIHILEKV